MTDRFNVQKRSLGRELEKPVSNSNSRYCIHGERSWGLSLASDFLFQRLLFTVAGFCK